MARLNNYLNLVAFFVASTIVIITISATKEESAAQCATHIGSHCGKEILGKLFSSDDTTLITPDCCYKLMQMGYECHTELTLYIAETSPEVKNANWTRLIEKNDEIFRNCDQITNPGSKIFLSRCIENLGVECGQQVYNKLIKDNNISKHCCQKVVKGGRPCHVAMVNELIRTPDMRDANATKLLLKNKKIFNHCLLNNN